MGCHPRDEFVDAGLFLEGVRCFASERRLLGRQIAIFSIPTSGQKTPVIPVACAPRLRRGGDGACSTFPDNFVLSGVVRDDDDERHERYGHFP